MYALIKERYLQGFITDSQLDMYARLGKITAGEAEEIKAVK